MIYGYHTKTSEDYQSFSEGFQRLVYECLFIPNYTQNQIHAEFYVNAFDHDKENMLRREPDQIKGLVIHCKIFPTCICALFQT